MCHSPSMQKDVEGPEDRERLEVVAADCDSTQKHLCRTRIILAADEGCGTAEAMRQAGVARPGGRRWQRRFMDEGLLREETCRPGKASVPDPVVVGLTAGTVGDSVIALTAAQKIRRRYGPARYRLRVFKLSRGALSRQSPRCGRAFASDRRRTRSSSRSARRADPSLPFNPGASTPPGSQMKRRRVGDGDARFYPQ
jgi:hypothetical protein